MLKLNIKNVGAEETRRQPTTLTSTPFRERRSRSGTCDSSSSFVPRRRFQLRAAIALLLLSALAASAADSPPVSVADAASPLQPLLDGLLGKYGWLTTVILVIGSLRILFKPVMLAIENYVKQTPSATDDDRLAKFEAGPIYKIVAFVLDLGASIKLPLISRPPRDPNDSPSL